MPENTDLAAAQEAALNNAAKLAHGGDSLTGNVCCATGTYTVTDPTTAEAAPIQICRLPPGSRPIPGLTLVNDAAPTADAVLTYPSQDAPLTAGAWVTCQLDNTSTGDVISFDVFYKSVA